MKCAEFERCTSCLGTWLGTLETKRLGTCLGTCLGTWLEMTSLKRTSDNSNCFRGPSDRILGTGAMKCLRAKLSLQIPCDKLPYVQNVKPSISVANRNASIIPHTREITTWRRVPNVAFCSANLGSNTAIELWLLRQLKNRVDWFNHSA